MSLAHGPCLVRGPPAVPWNHPCSSVHCTRFIVLVARYLRCINSVIYIKTKRRKEKAHPPRTQEIRKALTSAAVSLGSLLLSLYYFPYQHFVTPRVAPCPPFQPATTSVGPSLDRRHFPMTIPHSTALPLLLSMNTPIQPPLPNRTSQSQILRARHP